MQKYEFDKNMYAIYIFYEIFPIRRKKVTTSGFAKNFWTYIKLRKKIKFGEGTGNMLFLSPKHPRR